MADIPTKTHYAAYSGTQLQSKKQDMSVAAIYATRTTPTYELPTNARARRELDDDRRTPRSKGCLH